MKRLLLTAVLTVLMIAEVHAESFTISDIRVNGLQRVSAGSVFGALPLNVGEQADDRRLVESTRALFKTGFFQDIQLGREGNVLVITVVEVAVYYVPAMKPALVPTLLILSALKFALVAMFYMHLKFDHRLFSWLFVVPMLIAMSVIVALMKLFGVF